MPLSISRNWLRGDSINTKAMYTFKKPEHLCLQTEIETLFSAGSSSMSVFPIRATFRKLDYPGRGPKVKVLLSVSKRKLHHAVDRNRAKRQLREAYRLQKQLLWEQLPEGMALNIAFIWLADHPMKSENVHRSIKRLLTHMAEKVQQNAETAAPAPAIDAPAAQKDAANTATDSAQS